MNSPGRHITEGILAAVLILGPAITIGIIADAKAGSIADWVAALATLGALIAAVYAGQQAAEIVRVERGRDDDVRDKERESQAGQVAGWVANNNYLVMANLSNLPVYDLHVRYELEGHTASEEYGALVPTTRDGIKRPIPSFDQVLNRARQTSSLPDSKLRPRVTISFTDAAGVRWERHFNGQLDEIPLD